MKNFEYAAGLDNFEIQYLEINNYNCQIEKNELFTFHKSKIVFLKLKETKTNKKIMISMDEENLVAFWELDNCIFGPKFIFKFDRSVKTIVSTF